MAYSQAVSDTVQAEVQQFRSGVSGSKTPGSKTPGSSSAELNSRSLTSSPSSESPSPSSTKRSPSSIERSSSSESPSPRSAKRTRCTIHNYLTNKESEIMAFGALDKYIVNGVDVVQGFKAFKKSSIEHTKKATYFDQTYDIHRML